MRECTLSNKMRCTFECKFAAHSSKIGLSQIRWNAFNMHMQPFALYFVTALFSFSNTLSLSLSLSHSPLSVIVFHSHICSRVVDARWKWHALPFALSETLSLSLFALPLPLTAIKWAWTEMWFTEWSWAYIKSSECASDGMDVYTPLKAIFQLFSLTMQSERAYWSKSVSETEREREDGKKREKEKRARIWWMANASVC